MVLPPLRERWITGGQKCAFRELTIPTSLEFTWKPIWKTQRARFFERGYSMKLDNGKWTLCQWLLITPTGHTLTQIGHEKLESLRNPNAELAMTTDAAPQLVLPPLPSELEAKLFDYQVQPARQLLNALMTGNDAWGYPGAWDCSDLGTGKTYQALAAAIATGLEVGVVCPLSVIPAWKNAFKHFGHHPRFVLNYESLRTGKRDYVKIESFSNPNTGRSGKRFKWKLKPEDTILLYDEAHCVKNSMTKNQALAIASVRDRFPLIFISGTIANDPTHMRATGRAVGLHNGLESYSAFLASNGCTENYGGKTWVFNGGVRGRAHLARIHSTVFPKRGARTRIVDLGDRFPETQILVEAYETGYTDEINKAFKEAGKTIENLKAQGMGEGQAKMLQQSAWMKAFHESERLKIPAIIEKAEEELEEGRSVVVFVNFTDVREELMRRLKTGCAIFGGQPAHHRERCIAEFQADEARVLIANIDAGGVGVSLHDLHGNHPRTAIILPTCKVTSIVQALGRVHRAGGKSRSRQIIFYSVGFEEEICKGLRRKIQNLGALNEGDVSPETIFDSL